MKRNNFIVKTLVVLACVCILSWAIPTGSFAAQAEQDGWIYRIMSDGSAEVTGYSDQSVTELTIPLKLGNAWVTSIGDGAFSDHEALTQVTIPVIVTSIGENAFGGTTTIRAYNGSDALRYAANAGLNTECLSELEFFSDVLDLSEMTGWGIRDGALLAVSAPFDALILPGAKLYLPANEAYPTGYAVQVQNVYPAPHGITAQVVALEFGESVERYYAENVLFTFDPNSFIPAPGVTVETPALSAAPRDAISAALSVPLNLKAHRSYGDDLELNFNAGLTNTMTLSVKYENFKLEMVSADVTNTFVEEITVTGKIEDEIPLGSYPFASNGVLSASVNVSLFVGIQGEASLRFSASESYNIFWTDAEGSKENYVPMTPEGLSVSINGSFEGGLLFSPAVKLGFAGAGADIFWLDCKVGFYLESSYTTLAPYCLDIRGGVRITADAGIGFRTKDVSLTFLNTTIVNLSRELLSYHLEGADRIVQDECTYEGICTVSFVTGGEEIKPKKYAAGRYIYSLPTPVREGHIFEAWYTDAKLTTLFDFNAPLPEGALTLYAAWEGDRATPTPAAPGITPPPPIDENGTPITPTPAPSPTVPKPTDWVDPIYDGTTSDTMYKPTPGSGSVSGYEMRPDYDVAYNSTDATFYGYDYLKWNSKDYDYPDSDARYSYTVPGVIDNTYKRYKINHIYEPYFDEETQTWKDRYLYSERVIDESIPYETYRVTAIDINSDRVESLTIDASLFDPYSLNSIKIHCTNLRELHLINFDPNDQPYASLYLDWAPSLTELTIEGIDYIELGYLPSLQTLTIRGVNWSSVRKGSSYHNLNKLTTLNLSDGFVDNVFNNCASLTTINTDNEVKLNGAFNYCPSLTDVNLVNLYSLYNCFNNCENLQRISLDDSYYGFNDIKYVGNDCPKLAEFDIPSDMNMYRCFNGGTPLEVTVPLNRISADSFDTKMLHVVWDSDGPSPLSLAGRSNLLSVDFTGDGSIYLPDKAFANCPNLRYVRAPGSRSGSGQFDGCQNVEFVIAGNDKGLIESNFSRYLLTNSADYETVFSSITLDQNTVKTIGAYAFAECLGIKGVLVLPESLEAIEDFAFQNCDGITAISYPSNTPFIGTFAFAYCDGLQTLTLPAGAESWESGVFRYCSSLEDVTVSSGLTAIPEAVFANCPKLKEISIPSSVTEIGSTAFISSGLTSFDIPRSVTKIGAQAYGYMPWTSIDLPDWEIEYGSYVFTGCDFEEINIPATWDRIPDAMFVLCENLSKVTIPEGVTTIGASAFVNCDSLKGITLPNTVTTIESDAFRNCDSLKSISIPEGVTTIGDSAFASCSGLSEIKLPSTLKEIGDKAFYDDTVLCSIVLPEGLTSIGDYAFRSTSVTDVVLPASLQWIGSWAFEGNVKNITILNGRMEFAEDFILWPYSEDSLIVRVNLASPVATYIKEYHSYSTVLLPLDSEVYSVTYFVGTLTSWTERETEMVYSGMLLTRPTNPERRDCTFTGWYEDPECTKLWDFDTMEMPEKNIALYSGWDELEQSTLDPCDGGYVYAGGIGTVITIPDQSDGKDVIAIGKGAIGSTVTSLHIPATVTSIDPDAFELATQLKTITVDEDNPAFYAIDNVLFSADGTLLFYPRFRPGKTYTTPEGTTGIARRAFMNPFHLETLTLSSGVKTLAAEAISRPGYLERIIFTADVTSIDPGAILAVRSLEIDLPDDAPVLSEFLRANGISVGMSTLVYAMDNQVIAVFTVPTGEVIPEDLVPVNAEYETSMQYVAGWSVTGSADRLWDFEATPVPEGILTLHAVMGEYFDYTISGSYMTLTKYNGTSTSIEIPYYYKGFMISSIANDCFGDDPSGITLSGGYSYILQQWARKNGATYVPMTCTVRFDTGCDIVVEPITGEVDANISLPFPERYGYKLSHWTYTDHRGIQTSLSNSSYSTLRLCMKEYVMTAVWVENSSYTSDELYYSFIHEEDGVVITGVAETKEDLVIPETLDGANVVGIGDNAFANSGLVSLTLPDTVTRIGKSAFAGSTLASLTLPDSVVAIGDRAFQNCAYLTEMDLPDTLSSLGEGAFDGCRQLKSISLPTSLETLPAHALAHCLNLKELAIPAGMTELDLSALTGCTRLTAIHVDESNAAWKSIDGVLFNKSGATLYLYPLGKSDADYAIPEGVTSIASGGMRGCRIINLTIPASISEITDGMLNDSMNLRTISCAPGCSLIIGANAFSGCTQFTALTVPANVTSIGSKAFSGCAADTVTVLNDAVVLADDAITLSDTAVVYANAGSTGEAWAIARGATIVTPDDVLPTALSLTDALVRVGETIQLSPVFTPADATITAVRWDIGSSTRGILSVDDNGVVTALAVGTAKVYAYGPAGLEASCTITVYREHSEIQRIKLSSTEMTLQPGDTKELTATLDPSGDEEILWSTTNEDVASYDPESGCVIAFDNGTAAITAYTASGVRASCMVEVTSGPVTNGPIYLDMEFGEFELYEDFELYCWIEDDEHCYDDIYWEVSDPEILEYYPDGDYASFLCIGEGTVTITAYTEFGYSTFCTVTIVEDLDRLILDNTFIYSGIGWDQELYFRDVPSTVGSGFSWSIDDPDIIEIYEDDDGTLVVRGLQEGSTDFYIYCEGGFSTSGQARIVFWGTMNLPASLTEIGDEAFVGTTAYYIEIPDGVTSIGSRAFADNYDLDHIHIPASVTYIADDAFENSYPYFTGEPGSYAETYADEYGYGFSPYPDRPGRD